MFLLRFTFGNHRSFRDESEMTLVHSRLKSALPHDGSWREYTHRVAAIYGANASGKSGVLEALAFMRDVIRHSAVGWSEQKRLPRIPFALDPSSRKRPSTFALDFVLADTRFEYGFSLTEERITEEWLYTYPAGRKRILFERGSDPSDLTFGRELKGGDSTLRKVTGPRELVLSKGASLRNEQLSEIYHALTTQLAVARFSEIDRHGRLRQVIEDIIDGTLSMSDLHIMLKVADVGIAGADIMEEEIPPRLKQLLHTIVRAEHVAAQDGLARAPKGEEESENLPLDADVERGELQFEMNAETIDQLISDTARSLKFRHIGKDEQIYGLTTGEQSTGTLSWLSLAAPALRILRLGGVFAVDELDASLHPQLSQVMIQMFRDERLNTKGSQLIFTTHDTFYMSPTSEVPLHPEEIWLAEKGRGGASELFSIADFPTRRHENLARRYLQGRYGAVPSLAPSFLSGLTDSSTEPDPADVPHEEGVANGFALT